MTGMMEWGTRTSEDRIIRHMRMIYHDPYDEEDDSMISSRNFVSVVHNETTIIPIDCHPATNDDHHRHGALGWHHVRHSHSRRQRHKTTHTEIRARWTSFVKWSAAGVLLLCSTSASYSIRSPSTTSTSATTTTTRQFGVSRASASSLFRQQQPTNNNYRQGTTARRMVLTTPESIIEQASTKKLLDILIDESVRTSARRPIMMQFDPSSGWIWRRWKGTVFSETWVTCVRNVLYACLVLYLYRTFPKLHGSLNGFNTLWGQLLSVTTFTLTFFVNQSYALWRKCYELSRRLQGRLNDLDLTLACHAARKNPASPSEPSSYTSASRQLLDLISRYVRLFNLLTYASFTRSHRPMLTPRGMRRLVERGLMTSQERAVLIDAEIPATQRHNCVLMWITRVFIEGRQAGHFTGGSGFEQQFLEKMHVIRAQYGAIGDELQGRMPLAYAHIVQVLVDCVLWMYPLMAFSSGMSPMLGILGTGLLTTSYQGLFDLAKQFLDPYDNEAFGKGEDPLSVDTLIAETNAGSLRWMYGFEEFPVSSQRIKDGELFDYLLPVRGYSVEEIEKMEQEKLRKEMELKETREREEAERLEAEEREAGLEEEETDENEEESEESRDDEDDQIDDSENIDFFERNVTVTPGKKAETAGFNNIESATSSSNATSLDSPENLQNIVNATISSSDDGKIEKNESLSKHHTVTFTDDGLPVSLSQPEATEALSASKNNRPAEPQLVADMVSASMNTTTLLNDKFNVSESKELSDPSTMPQSNGEEAQLQSTEALLAADIAPQSNQGLVDMFVDGDSPDLYDDDFNDSIFRELPWFDEVGPDGQEIRLSQMLADESWEEEMEYANEKEMLSSPITLEEYSKREAELEEAAKQELLETEEVMNARPGDRGRDMIVSKKTQQAPSYDQTKLDGISQLWGFPLDDVDELPGVVMPDEVSKEENRFQNVNMLWGNAPDAMSANQEPASTQSESSFDGISQLWDGALGNDEELESNSPRTREMVSDSTNDDYEVGFDDDEDEDLDFSSYEGYEWYGGGEGERDRLSQMLADEVWEPEETPQITSLEEYTKRVAEILEATEEEILETQAILSAPPGADSVVLKEDENVEKKAISAYNNSDAMNPVNASDADIPWDMEDDDLDALGMDDDGIFDVNAVNASSTETVHELSDDEVGEVGEEVDDNEDASLFNVSPPVIASSGETIEETIEDAVEETVEETIEKTLEEADDETVDEGNNSTASLPMNETDVDDD